MRATSKCRAKFVDWHYYCTRNAFKQVNPLVQARLWEMSGGGRDAFDETCRLLANNVDGILSIFNLPFRVRFGTEKISIVQKMVIALLMHQKSPFSESNSHQRHLDYVFSQRSGSGKHLDGKQAMVLQERTFIINCGGGVHEVPNDNDLPSDSADVVKVYEVVFDTKGSSKCNHSLWFDVDDPICESHSGKDDVNAVRTLPYIFLQPFDKEGQELLDSMMKELIAHNGSIGPMSNDLREQFNSLKTFHSNLAWPKTKTSAEATTTLKPIVDYVHSAYAFAEGEGRNVKPIWESVFTNLAFLRDDDDEAPQGHNRLAAFPRMNADHCLASSSLPKLKETENIVDFLGDYAE